MRDNRCLIHALVPGQQRLAATFIANEELAVDEIVAAHLDDFGNWLIREAA